MYKTTKTTTNCHYSTYDGTVVKPYMVTKTSGWEYQKEWRIVASSLPGESGHHSDYGFISGEIRSVYLGCGISDQDAKDIISLLNHELSHVRTYQARPLEYERKLSFERIR